MLQIRSALVPLVVAMTVVFSSSVLAQERPPQSAPSAEQVEQLQNQLAEMKKELDAMRKALEAASDTPEPERQAMEDHIGQMQRYWQQMRDGCCGMHPHSHHCRH